MSSVLIGLPQRTVYNIKTQPPLPEIFLDHVVLILITLPNRIGTLPSSPTILEWRMMSPLKTFISPQTQPFEEWSFLLSLYRTVSLTCPLRPLSDFGSFFSIFHTNPVDTQRQDDQI